MDRKDRQILETIVKYQQDVGIQYEMKFSAIAEKTGIAIQEVSDRCVRMGNRRYLAVMPTFDGGGYAGATRKGRLALLA